MRSTSIRIRERRACSGGSNAASTSSKPVVARQQYVTRAVQANDPRRPFEGAEHDDDAPVFAQVRDRLRSTPDEVEVGDLPRAEDPEPAEIALRRDVDVPVAGERRRADEEEALRLDPGAELAADFFEDLAYRAILLSGARGIESGVATAMRIEVLEEWARLHSVVWRIGFGTPRERWQSPARARLAQAIVGRSADAASFAWSISPLCTRVARPRSQTTDARATHRQAISSTHHVP